jgi:hypothetical protein
VGYTQYYYTKEHLDSEAFKNFSEDVKEVLKEIKVPIAFEQDQPNKKPTINSKMIRFNGIGEGGHETFLLVRDNKDEPKEDGTIFNFCKTAQKPYDLCVTACLILAKYHFKDAVNVSSDGEASDWQEAVEVVNKVFSYNMKVEDIAEGISITQIPRPENLSESEVTKILGEPVTT